MGKWIKKSALKTEVGPGARIEALAGGNIVAYAPVKIAADGDYEQCSASGTDCIGISGMDSALISGDDVVVIKSGEATVVADVAVVKGDLLKVGYAGTVTPALSDTYDGASIKAAVVGLSFTNQPANDGLEIGSSSALDTMPIVIYGTTNGGVVVVREQITLTGTTFVSTVKTNWGVVLGFEIPEGYPTAVGTITVREASGNATVSTLTAGNRQKGVTNVTGNSVRAFNRIISAVGSGATTKVVGVVGTTSAGVAQYKAITLAGTAIIPFLAEFRTVTKVLTGDLESSRTVTIAADTVKDTKDMVIGVALENAVAGAEFTMSKHSEIESSSMSLTNIAKHGVQVIDMADAQVALVLGVAGAGEVRLTSNVLFVDANSGATEDLLLPAAASSSGMVLWIFNTGGEDIILKDSTDTTTYATISTTEGCIAGCGSTWQAGVIKTT